MRKLGILECKFSGNHAVTARKKGWLAQGRRTLSSDGSINPYFIRYWLKTLRNSNVWTIWNFTSDRLWICIMVKFFQTASVCIPRTTWWNPGSRSLNCQQREIPDYPPLKSRLALPARKKDCDPKWTQSVPEHVTDGHLSGQLPPWKTCLDYSSRRCITANHRPPTRNLNELLRLEFIITITNTDRTETGWHESGSIPSSNQPTSCVSVK